MADIKENECDSTTKRKKRQRGGAFLEKEDQVSRLQYEEDYAEGYLNKLFKELDEAMFTEMLAFIVKIEGDIGNLKEHYQHMESLVEDREDLKWALLGFLKPHQALECGELMSYYEIHTMKQFVRNLMFHFKRQPHSLRKIVDKLSELAESKDLRESIIEEEIAPLLQKNSPLMQQLLKLLPSEKPPDWYNSSEDTWEDFNIDNNDLDEEEILDVPSFNEPVNAATKNCLYVCKNNNEQTSLCPICSVKFINGRIFIANGRVLRSANLVFNANEEVENTIRLTGKADFFTPSVTRTRVHKRHKESVDGISSPIILGTESEEELGENDVRPRKRRRKNARRLKIRFNGEKEEEIKMENDVADNNHTDDTAASNDDGSCDDNSKDCNIRGDIFFLAQS